MTNPLQRPPKTDGRHTPNLWPVWLVAPGALLIVGAAAYGLYHGAETLLASDTAGKKPVGVQDIIKTTVTVLTLIGAVLAALYAYRKQLLDEGTSHRADATQLTERYSKSAEQLGHDQAAVRLAGVYAMARLADDWPEQRQVCVDVLCAYLRMPYATDITDPGFRHGEREVRLTIIRNIRDHLQHPDTENSWCGLNFDFTGATFDGGDLSGSTFSGGTISFNGSTFSRGTVRFNGSTFSGGTVSFSRSNFSGGTASFRNSKFSGGEVSFALSKFSSGQVELSTSEFSGGVVSFRGSEFRGSRVNLRGSEFSGATVSFRHSTYLLGSVAFGGSNFSGGEIGFSDSSYSGGTISFRRSKFCGSTVSFNDSGFSGGEVSFRGSEYLSGTVSFDRARFSGASVSFQSSTYFGGNVSFSNSTHESGTVDFQDSLIHANGSIHWGPFPVITVNAP